jgi:peroxiredoxin
MRWTRWLAAILMSFSLAAVASDSRPDFTLKAFDGSNVRLAEYRGDVVLVNFWASWCGPCLQEMPELEDLYQRYRDLGVTILAINVEEDDSEARRFAAERQLSFPLLADGDNTVTKLLGVDAMPTTLLIDKDGELRYRHRGYKPGYEDKYEEQIRSLMRE